MKRMHKRGGTKEHGAILMIKDTFRKGDSISLRKV